MRMDRYIELTYDAWHGVMFLHCLSMFVHVWVPWRCWLLCLLTGQHATVKSSSPSKPQDGLPSPLNLGSRLGGSVVSTWKVKSMVKEVIGICRCVYIHCTYGGHFEPVPSTYYWHTQMMGTTQQGHTGHRNAILEITDDVSWELEVKMSLWTNPHSLCTQKHVHACTCTLLWVVQMEFMNHATLTMYTYPCCTYIAIKSLWVCSKDGYLCEPVCLRFK